MALTRKFLKAMGVEDEKIDEIINAHTETVDGLKEQIKNASNGAADLEAITQERDTLQQELETLRQSKGDATEVQAAFDSYKATVEKEKATALKKAAMFFYTA